MFPLRDNLPTDRLPIVTVALIAINVFIYLLLQPKSGIDFNGGSLNQAALAHYGAIPYELTHLGKHCDFSGGAIACEGMRGVSGTPDPQAPTYLTVFTGMFTHAGLLHLGGNMLFLWIFGNNIEDAMGKVKFLLFYLLGGIAAVALQTAIDPNSSTPTLGASGAIAAVLGGYILIYPRARVLTLIWIVVLFFFREIPAMFFLVIWFAQQAVFGYFGLTNAQQSGGGGVAYFAHIGGFVFGLLAVRALAHRRSSAYEQRF